MLDPRSIVKTELDPALQRRGVQLMGEKPKVDAKWGTWSYREEVYDGPGGRARIVVVTKKVLLYRVWLAKLMPIDKLPKSGDGSPGSESKHFGFVYTQMADGSKETFMPKEFVSGEKKAGRIVAYNPATALALARAEALTVDEEDDNFALNFVDDEGNSIDEPGISVEEETEEKSASVNLLDLKKVELISMYKNVFGKDVPNSFTKSQIAEALNKKESELTDHDD